MLKRLQLVTTATSKSGQFQSRTGENSAYHLFWVHSNLAYLMAISIIAHEKLEERRCLLVLSRGMEIDSKIKCVRLWADRSSQNTKPRGQWFSGTLQESLAFWRVRSAVRGLDQRVESLTAGSGFYAYIPNTHPITCQLLATHANCLGFSLFEEGTTSMYMDIIDARQKGKGFARTALSLFGYGRRVSLNKPRLDLNYKQAYSVTQQAFPFLESKTVLDLVEPPEATLQSEAMCFDHAVLVVVDSFVENGYTSLQAYVSAMRDALNSFLPAKCSHSRPIFVKFHPHQSQSVKEGVISVMESVIGDGGYKLLKPSFLVELILLKTRGVLVINGASSLGWYAYLWGHKVYSFAERIADYDPGFWQRLDLPSQETLGVMDVL